MKLSKESGLLLVLFVVTFGVLGTAVGRVVTLGRVAAKNGRVKPSIPVLVTPEFAIGSRPDFENDPESPYTLVEFMDYECPPCCSSRALLPPLLERYRSKLRLTVRHFPLTMHKNALPAALVAEAARTQGKFAVMDELLMDADDFSESTITGYVAAAGLDTKRFATDRAGTVKNAVQDDVDAANRMGLTGTPTFYLCTPTGTVFKLSSPAQVSEFIR